jgi:hypothetical protein
MASEPSDSAATPGSDVRFNIRTLLLAMVGVAIVAGIMGPLFRRLEGPRRVAVVQSWGVCAVIVLLWLGWSAWVRFRLERAAGPTLYELMPAGAWFRKVRPWRTIAGGMLWIALGSYYLVVYSAFGIATGNIFGSILFGSFVAFLLVTGLRVMWWNRTVQLRENGLLRGLRLLRWSHMTRHQWDLARIYQESEEGTNLFVEGVDQRHKDLYLAINVPMEKRAAIESLLMRKQPARIVTTVDGESSDSPKTVSLPYLPIKQRDEISTSRVTVALAGTIALSVIFLSVSPRQASPEFFLGALLSVIGLAFVASYRARSTRHSAAPLIRLSCVVDWPVAGGACAVILGGVFLEGNLPWWPPLSFVIGLVCGVGVFTIFESLFRGRFDLCENGVVLVGLAFWPWNRTRVLWWDAEQNGRLGMRCGWRRLISKVPENDRAAVDAVLRAKRMSGSSASELAAGR